MVTLDLKASDAADQANGKVIINLSTNTMAPILNGTTSNSASLSNHESSSTTPSPSTVTATNAEMDALISPSNTSPSSSTVNQIESQSTDLPPGYVYYPLSLSPLTI